MDTDMNNKEPMTFVEFWMQGEFPASREDDFQRGFANLIWKSRDAEIKALKDSLTLADSFWNDRLHDAEQRCKQLEEALESYAECGDGCTCGDGWGHEIAKAALSPDQTKEV